MGGKQPVAFCFPKGLRDISQPFFYGSKEERYGTGYCPDF